MRVTGIHANLPVADIAAARDFYTDYLGLSVEEFNMGGWRVTLTEWRGRRPARHSRRHGASRLGHLGSRRRRR